MRLQRGLETEARRQREEARYAGPRVRASGFCAGAACACRRSARQPVYTATGRREVVG